MAGSTGVTVRVISNNLPHLAGFIQRAAATEVKRAAYSIEGHAKARVAVRTGTLRRSIHSVFESGGLTGLVGPSVDYGVFVEFGTRHMGARPYMRPAAEAVLPIFVERLKGVIEAIAAGGGVPDLPSLPSTPPMASIPRKPKKARKKAKAVKVARPKHFESAGFKAAKKRQGEYDRLSRRAERQARSMARKKR